MRSTKRAKIPNLHVYFHASCPNKILGAQSARRGDADNYMIRPFALPDWSLTLEYNPASNQAHRLVYLLYYNTG